MKINSNAKTFQNSNLIPVGGEERATLITEKPTQEPTEEPTYSPTIIPDFLARC